MNARIAVLSLALMGCSFAFVRGAPDLDELPRGAPIECTNSDFWPMIDAIAVGGGALGLMVLSDTPSMQQDTTYNTLFGASLVSVLVYTASAIYGFVRASNCQDAIITARKRHPVYLYHPDVPASPSLLPEVTPAATPEENPAPPDGGQP